MAKENKEYSGVRAKLFAYKEAHAGFFEETLPKSGVTVQIPNFLNHGEWMKAQRQANGDVPKAHAAFITGTVTFEGEKLTMADIQAGLVEAKDMLFLIGEIFGDDEAEADVDDAGNDKAAA